MHGDVSTLPLMPYGVVGRESFIKIDHQNLCERKRPPSLQTWCSICVEGARMYMQSLTKHQVALSQAGASLLFKTY
jgi:hypothetical protein